MLQHFKKEFFEEHVRRVRIDSDLSLAIKNKEVYLVYQPVFDFKTSQLVGLEVLCRWKHSDYGLIDPAEFIPISEESGMIAEIGEWVISESAKQFSMWQREGLDNCKLYINLSPAQIRSQIVFEKLIHLHDSYNLKPNSIAYELTETAIMNETVSEYILKGMFEKHNIMISIDDFGTGCSSLARLKALPVNILKIDASFIQDISKDHDNEVIVKSIIALGKNLGLKIIAEGVETKEQLEFLRGNDCDYGQGFYLSEPKSVDQITKQLKEAKNEIVFEDKDR